MIEKRESEPVAIPFRTGEPVWLHGRNTMHVATFVGIESERHGIVRVRLADGKERIVSHVYVSRRDANGGAR